MNRATPWTIQSVDPDLRDAARDAAMRDGMTLHQWLQRAIAEHASEHGVNPALLDHEERAAAIKERLALTPEPQSPRLFSVDQRTDGEARQSGKQAINKVDDMLQDLATRLGDNARTAAARAAPAAPSAAERAEHQSALQEALRDALRMARREPGARPQTESRITSAPPIARAPRIDEMAGATASAHTGGARESGALRQQIDRLSHQIATPQPRDPGLDRVIPQIDRALDEAPRAIPEREATQDLTALRRLNAKTDEIRDLVASVIARPAQTNKIERQLDLLGARIDELAASASTAHEAQDLARGISDIRALINQGASPGQLDALDRKLDQLARKMETALSEERAAPQFDDLARRIDNVHRRVETSASIMARTDTAALERLMIELTRKLEQPAPKIEVPAPNFAPVESELRRLSNKVDTVAARPENPALEGLRRDVANLSSRVDAVSTTVQSATALASQTHAESLETLRKEVSGLSGRMDQIAASATEVSVLDGLQAQIEILVDRVEALPRRESASVQALEAQIVKLVGKIDTMAAPSREETMLAELQAEIARLSRQFGAAPKETSAPALAMLEQVQAHLATVPIRARPALPAGAPEAAVDKSISDLFQQIQDLREAAVDTVEAAEQLAAADVKPQPPVQAQAQAQAQPQAPVVDEALKRELSDLRAQQEIADRRTNDTLSAVHQTLEKLVGRLSDLELDLVEVRPEAIQQPVKAPTPVKDARQELAPELPREARKEPVLESLKVEPKVQPKVEPVMEPIGEPEPRPARKPGPGAVLSNQASFIAAARRATSEHNEEPKPKAPSRLGDILTHISGRASEIRAEPVTATEPEAESDTAQGPFEILRRAMSSRRRMMLIALAGLVVILGSLQALRSNRAEETPTAAMSRDADQKVALASPAPTRIVEPAAPDIAPEAPALPEAAIAAPTKVAAAGFTPPLAANGFDASPTASTPAPSLSPTGGATLQSPTRLVDAAANGLPSAQFEMGVRLADGRGMAQDNQAARQWLEKAANQNLAPAQYRFGAMLERGVGGAKDVKRAQDLYAKAAAQGHVRAMHNMGVLNAEGAEGKPDYVAAATWFRKAADFGLRDSQYNLAILYARGMGVEKNLPVSWAWFTIATAQGDADSAQKREEIGGRLTPAQLAAAKAMVEAYRARTPDPAANDVATPPGGWDMLSVTNTSRPAAPITPKAKVSKL